MLDVDRGYVDIPQRGGKIFVCGCGDMVNKGELGGGTSRGAEDSQERRVHNNSESSAACLCRWVRAMAMKGGIRGRDKGRMICLIIV